MTTNDAARELGLSVNTVRAQIKNRRLRAERRGRDWWITSAEVERYRRESRGKRALGAGASAEGARSR